LTRSEEEELSHVENEKKQHFEREKRGETQKNIWLREFRRGSLLEVKEAAFVCDP